ncbi:hypothetical protein GC175_17025 [bacterium]|nr:hypothetical protein [bacterium]
MAQVEVIGGKDVLWEILSWLRCPLIIYNSKQMPVWWGYVSEASVINDQIEHRVSIDEMVNRIAVAYSYVAPGSQDVGTRKTTAWVQDDTSVSAYGAKELLLSISGASDEQAENIRDETLTQKRYPQVVSSATNRPNGGTLLARGWWSTLDWRYYGRSNTDSTETTVQISTMIDALAEFITDVDVLDTTGISYSSYQDGEKTMGTLVLGWLRTPISRGKRLTAYVTPERRLRVEAEDDTEKWLLLPGNVFRDATSSRPLPAGDLPLGQTALRNVIPATANLTWLGAPSPFRIVEAEYNVETNRVSWRPRGLPSPWDLSQVVEG